MLDEALREKRSFLDQFTKPAAAQSGVSSRPHSKAFEAARPFSQEGLMLEVCFKAGRCRFLDSSGCVDAAYEKGDTLLALYPTAVLHVEGRNLSDLASLIKERRAQYVQEQHDEDAPEAEAYVDTIRLYKPEEWEGLIAELESGGRIAPRKERT